MKAILFLTYFTKENMNIQLVNRFSICWAHKLLILSPKTFVGLEVALQPLDPFFPMLILGVRKYAE
jgi:hypothetical protein